MKNIFFFFLAGIMTLASCDSESSDSTTPLMDFSGTYSGILNSEDDDNMDQQVVVNIASINNGSYTVDIIDDEGNTIFETVAAQDEDVLYYGWETVQTLTDQEVYELWYSLKYVDAKTLQFKMTHKHEYELEELSSDCILKRN